uniref:X-prolyl aminopeptidase 3, mitochondrial n=1 Tax=Hucho hucho TaxID=62062 RepID=A0A4W5PJK3_9TELE
HPHFIKNGFEWWVYNFFFLLSVTGEVTPGLTQTEFVRRERVASLIEVQADRLGPTASSNKHLVIVLSHPIRYMTNDIPYPFHQNQDFLYLTGILEPDSALVLCGTGRPEQAILFVPCRDPARELWDGPRSGKGEELGLVLKSLKGSTVWYDGSKPCHPGLHQTHVRPLLEGGPMVRSLRPLTHSLRALKSPADVGLMKEAGRITAQAFKKTMDMSQGDIDEAVLYAKFDFECRAHGANFLAYPPVVAGGNRANTLHYINNNQDVKVKGHMQCFSFSTPLLHGEPRFSPAQAELYEGVLEVQKACLSLCSPGVSLDHIYSTMLALLGCQLKQPGIVKGSTSDADALKAARRYCPHHVGHYLGMDVHDTPELSRSQPLKPGMAITIEPGLYICEDDDQVPEQFRGLGVRMFQSDSVDLGACAQTEIKDP